MSEIPNPTPIEPPDIRNAEIRASVAAYLTAFRLWNEARSSTYRLTTTRGEAVEADRDAYAAALLDGNDADPGEPHTRERDAAIDAARRREEALKVAAAKRWAAIESALVEHGGKAEQANAKRRSDAWRKLAGAVEKVDVARAEVVAATIERSFLRDPRVRPGKVRSPLATFPLTGLNHEPIPATEALAALRAWSTPPATDRQTTRDPVPA